MDFNFLLFMLLLLALSYGGFVTLLCLYLYHACKRYRATIGQLTERITGEVEAQQWQCLFDACRIS